MIELNKGQSYGVEQGYLWYKKQNDQIFEVVGPAGSGKTTVINFLIKKLGLKPNEVLFMALVGKATMAMARNGLNAKTIHSSIYEYVPVPKTDENGNPIRILGRVQYRREFKKKDQLPRGVKLIVVDEGGMINDGIGMDILSFGLPVVVLGDLNQLPPIFGKSFFLKNPNVILDEVMRQSLGNPIIQLSQDILNGMYYLEPRVYGENCKIVEKSKVTDEMLVASDILICGKNKTRDELNQYVRRDIKGIVSDRPMRGEKLICRQNNWSERLLDNIYLVNGLTGYVEHVYQETFNGSSFNIDFRPDFLDEYFENISVDYKHLFSSWSERSDQKSFYNKFEWAYAITCHLAQGAQYQDVLVWSENFGSKDFNKRWMYTAVTRAIDKLTIAV